jgi:DNA-binding beta-propeller fold protein YncE
LGELCRFYHHIACVGTPNVIDTFAGDHYYGDTRLAVKASLTGIISTFAGSGIAGDGTAGDGGNATKAQIWSPNSVAVDVVNNLVYISDYWGNRIRVVDRAI